MSGAYSFLIRFSRNDVSESNLLHHHSKEEIIENLNDRYIMIVRYQEDGEPVYRITEKGKHKRDD